MRKEVEKEIVRICNEYAQNGAILPLKIAIEKLLRQEREKQYDKVVLVLEKILGYCGILKEK